MLLTLPMAATPSADFPLSEGTVTFLFTDVEGSTTLWERYPVAMRAALARHDRVLRDAIETSDGRIIKTTGDGVFAVFGDAADALAACLAAQRALQFRAAEVPAPDATVLDGRLPVPLKVRMGLAHGHGRASRRRLFRCGPASRSTHHVGGSRRTGAAVCRHCATGVRTVARIRDAARDGRASAEGAARARAPAAGRGVRLACRFSAVGVDHGRAQPSGGARRLRRPSRAAGGPGATLRWRRAPRFAAGPRRHRQDAPRDTVRLERARWISRWRLVLRPVTGTGCRRHRACRCAGTRCAAGQGRSGDAARTRHRGSRTLPGDPRQFRAGRPLCGGHAGPMARPCEHRTFSRDHARSSVLARRGGRCARAAAAVGRRCALHAQGRGGKTVISTQRRRPGGDRSAREAAGRPAARDRARGGARTRDASADAAGENERTIQAARLHRRARRPAGNAACRVRLVLGPAVAARESGAGAAVGVRGRLHARIRGRRSGPVHLRQRAVAHGRAAIAGPEVHRATGD